MGCAGGRATAEQILTFYYPGTAAGTRPNNTLRVALSMLSLTPASTVTIWNPPGVERIYARAVGATTAQEFGPGWPTITRTATGYDIDRVRERGGPVVQEVSIPGAQIELYAGLDYARRADDLVVAAATGATSARTGRRR